MTRTLMIERLKELLEAMLKRAQVERAKHDATTRTDVAVYTAMECVAITTTRLERGDTLPSARTRVDVCYRRFGAARWYGAALGVAQFILDGHDPLALALEDANREGRVLDRALRVQLMAEQFA